MSGAVRMRAWRVHAYGVGPGGAQLERARVPPLRAPRELLVRVHQSSINPIDLAIMEGYGARVLNALRALEGADGVEFPLVGGRDFVGVVERAGTGARLRRGERVWGVVPPHRAGAHADYVAVDERWAGRAPAGAAEGAGGLLYAALSASAVLRAAGVWGARGAGARVLLLGLGGAGHVALQLLAGAGARVTVACAADVADRALELGAAAVVDRHAPDYRRLIDDRGPYEAVVDCAGVGGAEAARHRGARFATLTSPLLRETEARGLCAGVAAAAGALLAQNAAAAPSATSVRWAYFAARADDVELMRRLVERGRLRVWVGGVFPCALYPEALRRARGPSRGKLLVDFTDRSDPPTREGAASYEER